MNLPQLIQTVQALAPLLESNAIDPTEAGVRLRQALNADPDPRTLRDTFAAQVYDRADEIDPGSELHWESLAVGWLVAQGVEPDDLLDVLQDLEY